MKTFVGGAEEEDEGRGGEVHAKQIFATLASLITCLVATVCLCECLKMRVCGLPLPENSSSLLTFAAHPTKFLLWGWLKDVSIKPTGQKRKTYCTTTQKSSIM